MTTGLGPTDLITIFATIFADVAAIRASRSLPPLRGAHLGQEWLQSEESAPRIVVVPTHHVYEFARQPGTQPPTGLVTAINPRVIAVRLMHFDAHLWGNETPTPSNPLTEQDRWYSFNSTVELERELIGALMRNLGNVTNPRTGLNVRFTESRWQQPTNMTRVGRMLVLPFAIGTPVTDEPWVTTPVSSVAVDTTVVFPSGASSDQGTFTIP